jgi:hypothetical protein
MRLPQVNATRVAIRGPGFSAEGDLPATDGDAKWTGTADAYLSEEQVTSTAAGRLDLFRRDVLIIPGDLRPPVDLQLGDTVTFRYADTVQTRAVRGVRARLLAAMLATVRLDLEDV